MKKSNYPEQYQRIQNYMVENQLDAMLAFSLENFYWISESYVTTIKKVPDRLGTVICIQGEAPQILTCSIEASLVEETSWIQDIKTYEEFKDSPIAVLAELLKKKNLDRSRIGIEMDYLVARYYDELKSYLSQAEFVDVALGFTKLRMVKTEREIEILSHAAFVTEKAIYDSFMEARPGNREIDVLNQMIIKTLHEGGSEATGCFGVGAKSAIAHPIVDTSPMQRGDLVSVDFCASFNGYYSDIGRTAVVGDYNTKQDKIYTALYDVQRRLIEMVKPGLKACDIYFKAVELLKAAGLDLSLSHVGHGLGLILHEYPLFSPYCTQELKENMIINIEPFFVTDEGYHAEDTMIVTEDGARLLSTYADHSKIIRITD